MACPSPSTLTWLMNAAVVGPEGKSAQLFARRVHVKKGVHSPTHNKDALNRSLDHSLSWYFNPIMFFCFRDSRGLRMLLMKHMAGCKQRTSRESNEVITYNTNSTLAKPEQETRNQPRHPDVRREGRDSDACIYIYTYIYPHLVLVCIRICI